ncbi:MAG: DUF3800 domain-containing protein [Desulfobia sp.]
MYLFYVDETGNLDPETERVREDGTVIEKDWLYVLTAFGLFEHKWRTFYTPIIRKKKSLREIIIKRGGPRLDTSQCEIKSNWIRIPRERGKHPFLSRLTEEEIKSLVDTYYYQLNRIHIPLFSVIIDKRYLEDFMDHNKLHRKAWELLCERIQNYMAENHKKHKAAIITDDVGKKANISLAMKHSYFLESGTSSGLWMKNIIEMPLFVASELSEGVQFADLCSYSIYHAIKYDKKDYPFFRPLLPLIYNSGNTTADKRDGLKVFPEESPVTEWVNNLA